MHAVYDVALRRIDDFCSAHGLRSTLFAIGSDLERPQNGIILRGLSERGHAVENHSYAHRYDLSRWSRAELLQDIAQAQDAITKATGRTPSGFRAPGYTINDLVLDVLEELAFRFDSSVFPCPLYYGAKVMILAGMRVFGRTSASVVDTPRVVAAPSRPYRPGTPWFVPGSRRLVELPIQVTPRLRLPVIGTTIGLAGPTASRVLAHACADEPLVNLELHGIDFLAASDGLEHLAAYQSELRVPLSRRLDALSAVVDTLLERGVSFVRLDEAAESFHVRG
ncbi:MAG TPA: polysaccharide deacetylase family protein [Polyangium sp.]|nr:polysaccharide deacetylase family protein [Polyangium sp.]